MKMNGMDWVAYILVVVGALNWGLVGFLDWNLVEALLGAGTVARVVYALVGLSALWMLFRMKKM